MTKKRISIFFELLVGESVVKRALIVALVVGVVLNLINQWEAMLLQDGSKLHYFKFFLTFLVPYAVSSYSSVMAKLSFKVGDVAPISAVIFCKACGNKTITINKGDVIPECPKCGKQTKWLFLKKADTVSHGLGQNSESMALFAQYNPAPVFRFSEKGVIEMSNLAANNFFEQDITGSDVRSLLNELESIDFGKIIEDGEIRSFVEEVKDVIYRFEIRGVPKLGVCQVYGANITEIVETKLDNLRLTSAISQTSNSIMMTDVDGNIVFVNRAFENITGYKREEVMGKNPRFLKTGELGSDDYKKMWETISSGNVWKGEFHNKKKDRTTYWEEATISPIVDEQGYTINYMSVKEDITEQKAVRKELKSMAMFAELNPEPVFRFNCNGEVLKSNSSANKAFVKNSIEGEHIHELLPSTQDLDVVAVIDNADIITIEEEIGDKIFRFILRGLPEFSVCQIYGSDVTQRRKAEQEVKEQKEKIEQSINYASRIQNAVLPSSNRIKELLTDFFILFKPRDVVSGDFYWMTRKNNTVVIVAADCTGHGVPGAFMSMLGVSFLNDIVIKGDEYSSNRILDKLRDSVKVTLSQSGSNESKDGMDIAIVVIDYDTMKLQYSGAYNPLLLIKNDEVQNYKADKMPIGSHLNENKLFKSYEIDVSKGDKFYIFSDGYQDQFGGDKGMKYLAKKFRNRLVELNKEPMSEQEEILSKEFEEWRGNWKQVDDVLVIGGEI